MTRTTITRLSRMAMLAALFFAAAGFARAAELDRTGFEYRNFTAADGSKAHIYIVRLPQDYTFAEAKRIVRALIDDSRQRKIASPTQLVKFFITGHGWKASAESYMEYAAFLSGASRADISIVCDFPEFRTPYPLNWHSLSVKASRKTAAIMAAVNSMPDALIWSMYGTSGMAENIIRMYDVVDDELRPLLSVKSNVVVDSYPFSAWPFVPRKVNPQWMDQIGGTLFVNYTLFGHWSNTLEGGAKCVNICIAPRGQAAPHSHYDTMPETRELERLEMSGSALDEILNYVDETAPCGKSLEQPAAQQPFPPADPRD